MTYSISMKVLVKFAFFTNNMGILGVDLDKINIDYDSKVQANLKLLLMPDFWLG